MQPQVKEFLDYNRSIEDIVKFFKLLAPRYSKWTAKDEMAATIQDLTQKLNAIKSTLGE